jgi:ferritin-like metal-binding protein YciE
LIAWAKGLGHAAAVGLLQEILDEEEAADKKLTALAQGGINDEVSSLARDFITESDEVLPADEGGRIQ